MNPRTSLALASMAVMTRMYEDNQPFRPYEPSEPSVDQVRFSDKCKSLFGEPHRELKEFSIKGRKVMAYSKKDAISRLKHQKKL